MNTKIDLRFAESDEGEENEVSKRGEFGVLCFSAVESVNGRSRIGSNHNATRGSGVGSSKCMSNSESDGESFSELNSFVTDRRAREEVIARSSYIVPESKSTPSLLIRFQASIGVNEEVCIRHCPFCETRILEVERRSVNEIFDEGLKSFPYFVVEEDTDEGGVAARGTILSSEFGKDGGEKRTSIGTNGESPIRPSAELSPLAQRLSSIICGGEEFSDSESKAIDGFRGKGECSCVEVDEESSDEEGTTRLRVFPLPIQSNLVPDLQHLSLCRWDEPRLSFVEPPDKSTSDVDSKEIVHVSERTRYQRSFASDDPVDGSLPTSVTHVARLVSNP